MPRRIWVLLLLAALSPRAVSAISAGARLGGERAGGALVGGEMASVGWAGLPVPPGADEWEAFLSLDGGATFPIRLTPHLDLSVPSFRYRVPDFPTRDGRILLRFGDERLETVVSEPERVTIAKGSLQLLPPRISVRPGEPVLPGRHGVVFWTEGTRRGGHLETYAVAETDPSLRGVSPAAKLWLPLAGPPTARTAIPLPSDERTTLPAQCGSSPEPASEPRGPNLPVRLLIGRRNE